MRRRIWFTPLRARTVQDFSAPPFGRLLVTEAQICEALFKGVAWLLGVGTASYVLAPERFEGQSCRPS